MIVRRLTAEDLTSFKTIRLEALRSEPDAFASSYEDAVAYSDDQWLRPLTHLIMVGAFDKNGTQVGLMGVAPETGLQMRHRGSLIMVYVAPSARRSGAAAKMLKLIEDLARDAGLVQLELHVRADNDPAVGFYTRAGYTPFGRLPGAARTADGEFDDLLMARRLDA